MLHSAAWLSAPAKEPARSITLCHPAHHAALPPGRILPSSPLPGPESYRPLATVSPGRSNQGTGGYSSSCACADRIPSGFMPEPTMNKKRIISVCVDESSLDKALLESFKLHCTFLYLLTLFYNLGKHHTPLFICQCEKMTLSTLIIILQCQDPNPVHDACFFQNSSINKLIR